MGVDRSQRIVVGLATRNCGVEIADGIHRVRIQQNVPVAAAKGPVNVIAGHIGRLASSPHQKNRALRGVVAGRFPRGMRFRINS